jgi:Ser/Thr protein kinase RdoA (MazF antagonist)
MTQQPYQDLTPERVLDAAARLGCEPSGRFLALNSYENRVYLVEADAGRGIVLKFYRPGRWSDAQILEEHAFAAELAAAEIPVVAPLVAGGRTLHFEGPFAYAGYPRVGGRWPELETPGDRRQMGRFLGRMHAVGAVGRFGCRETMAVWEEMETAMDLVLDEEWVPLELAEAYEAIGLQLLDAVHAVEEAGPAPRRLRIHGDLHAGNVLWSDGPTVVDLDDCLTGPAVQDIWMLLPGENDLREPWLAEILEGYETFFSFDLRELGLIEALRARRIMVYAAWLGRRWGDPAFPRAFPWFAEHRFWEQHILTLKEQLAVMREAA